MIGLALRYGKTPAEFLESTSSDDICELLAYFTLQAESDAPPDQTNAQLLKIFSKPTHVQ